MNSDLTNEDKEEILSEFTTNCEFVFVDLTEEYFKGFPKVKRYPYTIYFI